MATFKDFGVVLREYDAGEANKRLVLLTEGRGKITVFSRGAKKTGTKLATGLFDCNEFVIFDGGSFLSLAQTTCLHGFGATISSNFEAFVYASSFLEILDKIILTGMDAKAALRLLLRGLAELSAGRSPHGVFAVFMFKLLQKEGFAPMLDGEYFTAEGLAANDGPGAIRFDPAASDALAYILNTDGKRAFAFDASEDVLARLCAAARLFLSANVDVDLKSLILI